MELTLEEGLAIVTGSGGTRNTRREMERNDDDGAPSATTSSAMPRKRAGRK